MSVTGIQSQSLEVTVVGCYNLEDKEWISRQDPYVSIEYGSNKFRTRTCTDGGKNPTFQEKFRLTLIEGLREINVVVWNNHTLKADEYIACTRVQLHKALSQGFDDNSWPLHNKIGRSAGEIRLILQYSNPMQCGQNYSPAAAQYAMPTCTLSQLLPNGGGSTQPPAVPPPHYPPTTNVYPPSPYTTPYPPQTYPTPPAAYSPSPSVLHPSQPPNYHICYPPQQHSYPPPPQSSTYYSSGPPSGTYPPAPY